MAARLKFLRTMHQIRISGDMRPIFYLDKTWVNQNHTLKSIWQDRFCTRGQMGQEIHPVYNFQEYLVYIYYFYLNDINISKDFW